MRGFTTIELLVTIAVLAILAALAGPSFTSLMERWRIRQATEDLQGTLFLARSEAIKRGGNVAIVKTGNGHGCANASTAADWGCGWAVFVDTNGDGTLNTGETILQQTAAPTRVEATLAEHGGSTSMQPVIKVDRWGMLNDNSATDLVFRLKPQGKDVSDPAAASLCIYPGGQIKRLSTATDACNN